MRPALGRTPDGGDGLHESRRRRRECILALLLICLALLSEAAAPPEGESWGAAGEHYGGQDESGERGESGSAASSAPGVAGAGDSGGATVATGAAGEDAAGVKALAEGDLAHPRADRSGGEGGGPEAVDYETVLREAVAERATAQAEPPRVPPEAASGPFGDGLAQEATEDEEAAATQISLVQPDKEADLEGLLVCSCTVVGEASPQRPVQLWLDMKQQCSVSEDPGEEGSREEAAEAPTAHPPPRLKRQLPDPDEYFMAEKQQPVRLFPGSDDEQRADQAGPVPVVEGLQQCDPSLSERANMASVKMGAKVLAANPEATRLSEVLKSDPDTYLKSDCKTKEGRWLVLELPQVIKVEAITLSVMEVYSSRLKTIHVLGRDGRLNGGAPEVANSRNSSEWSMIAELRAENRRGLHVFILPKRRWAKFLQFRFEGHYGNQMVCAVNEIEVFGLTKAEEILKELEAVAGGPEVAVSTEQSSDQAEQPAPSAQLPSSTSAPQNGKAEGPSAGADSAGGESGGPDGGPREAEGGAPQAGGPSAVSPDASSQAAATDAMGAESPAGGPQAIASKDAGPEGQKAAEEPSSGDEDAETAAQGGPAEADPTGDAAGEAAGDASAQDGGSSVTQQQQQQQQQEEEEEEGEVAASVEGPEAEAGAGLAAAASLSGASARPAGATAGGERQPQDAVSELRLPQTALHPPNASAVINMDPPGSLPSTDMIEFAASLSSAGARGPSAVIDMFFQELKVQKLEQVYNKRYMKDAVANITLLFAEHDEQVSSLEGEIGNLRSSLKALESSSHTRLDQASVQERRLRKAMEEAQEQLRELSASVSALQRQQALLLAVLCIMVLLRGGSGGGPAAPAPAAVAAAAAGGGQAHHAGLQPQYKLPQQQQVPEGQPSDTLRNGGLDKGRRGGKGGAEPGKKRQHQQQQQQQQQQPKQLKQQRPAPEAPLQRGQPGAEGTKGGVVRRVRWVLCAVVLVVGWLGLGDANFEATGSDLLKKAAALWS